MKRNFKLLHIIVFIAVILSLLCITVSAADGEVVLGDMNGDSTVNINDAIYLLKHTMMPSRYPVSQPADVNGTGDVNIDDAIYLLKHTMMPSRYPITILGTYYTITWKNNDGTVLKTTLCEEDKIPSFGDETPTKESDSQYTYTFSGWATEIKTATEDATYVALYTKQARTSYTISYDANGGTNAPSSQGKGKGTSINLTSSIPTNEGKTFIGWSCANDGKVYREGASFNVDADVTLYAVWGHDCSTCAACGIIPTTVTCSKCSGWGSITDYYEYWDPCDDCRGEGDYSYSITCPSCKASGGAVQKYCDKCNGAGKIQQGAQCSSCSGNEGCYRTGSKSYSCQPCYGSGRVSSTMTCTTCNGDKAVADTYSSYTVTLNDRKSTVGTLSVTINTPYKLTVPVRSGYTFLGWFDAEANGTQYTDGEGVCLAVWSDSENKTLYARWSLNYYTITYDCDEGVNIDDMPTLYTVEDEDYTLNCHSREYYKFDWLIDNKVVAIFDTSTAKDVIVKGIWTPIEYTITYNLDGGSANNKTTYNVETDTFSLIAPTKAGYAFIGWTGSNGNTPQKNVTITTGQVGDLSFSANWVLNTNAIFDPTDGYLLYNITLVWGGGLQNEVLSYESGVSFCPYEFEVPNRSGYLFCGWYLDSSFKTPLPESLTITTDTMLYAKWLKAAVSSPQELTDLDNRYTCSGSNGYKEIYFYVSPEHSGEAYISYYLYGYEHVYSSSSTSGTVIQDSQFLIKDVTDNINTTYYLLNKGAYWNAGSGMVTINLEAGRTYKLILSSRGSSGEVDVTISRNWIPTDSNKCEISSTVTWRETYDELTQYPIPIRDGYDFVGWYAEDGTPIHCGWDYTTDQVFKARWALHDSNDEKSFPNVWHIFSDYIIKEMEPSTGDNVQYKECIYCGYKIEVKDGCISIPRDPVIENLVEATCSEDGHYDSVVYCAVCNEELSREKKTITKLQHLPKDSNYTVENDFYYPFDVSESNMITSSNKANGSKSTYTITAQRAFELKLYYLVSSEENCDFLTIYHNSTQKVKISGGSTVSPGWYFWDGSISISMQPGDTVTINYSKNSSGSSASDLAIVDIDTIQYPVVVENRVEATCTEDGHYDNVVYCEICDGEISRDTITIPASHSSRRIVEENKVEATTCTDGYYDSVAYCEICDKELSRSRKTLPAPHNIEKGICTICGYEYFSSGLGFTSNGDGTCYLSAIDYCTDTDVYIPRTSPQGDVVTSIDLGLEMTDNWRRVTSITIPDSVTSIGSRAFAWNWTHLTSITFGENSNLSSIGEYAFYQCTGLTSITLPDSVKSIGAVAFSGCTNLTSIKYRGTRSQWSDISKGTNWNYNTGSYTITYNYTGE